VCAAKKESRQSLRSVDSVRSKEEVGTAGAEESVRSKKRSQDLSGSMASRLSRLPWTSEHPCTSVSGDAAARERRLMAAATSTVAAQLQDWASEQISAITVATGGSRTLVQWEHYPTDDVCEPNCGLRYYYHCHESPRATGEHGHFHVFVDYAVPTRSDETRYSHLVGISVDAYGLPISLFTVNRWVTGGCWLPARELLQRAEQLLSAVAPSASKHSYRELTAFIVGLTKLFAPEICALLAARDTKTAGWNEANFEDRRREILTKCPISMVERLSTSINCRSLRRDNRTSRRRA